MWKIIVGVLLMFIGVILGLYVGGWVMFVGGIVQIIEAIKASPVEAMGVACGALRVVCAAFVGGICFWVSFLLGLGFVKIGLSE